MIVVVFVVVIVVDVVVVVAGGGAAVRHENCAFWFLRKIGIFFLVPQKRRPFYLSMATKKNKFGPNRIRISL